MYGSSSRLFTVGELLDRLRRAAGDRCGVAVDQGARQPQLAGLVAVDERSSATIADSSGPRKGPAVAIVTIVDPVANAGVADTLEARLADVRKRHADGEYGTIPLLIVELGIRSQWATEHPSRLVSPRPVRNEGGVDDEVDDGARVNGNNGTKKRGVIKVDGGVDKSQARVQRSTAAAGNSRADDDGRRRSPLRSGGRLSATRHVTTGGIAPMESIEPQLEVAGLKGSADGTVPIPPVDDVGLCGEFRAAHLLTFMVISRCCSPVVQLALGSCRERLDAGHQAWHFILSSYQAGEDFQAVAAAVQANPMAVLLNSGCSHHLMGTKAVFVDMAPSDDVKHVDGFNGALQPVKGRGTVALQGEAGKQVLIPDVLYVPGVQANVLSAGQLKGSEVQIQGDGDEMLLVTATGEVLGRARYNGRVLCTDLCPCSTQSSSTEVVALRTIASALTPDRLHARLAHVGVDTIKSSAKHGIATGLNIKPSTGADTSCVSCIGGKLV
ncbi:unnamed protein product [Closterium sp. NIES-54]